MTIPATSRDAKLSEELVTPDKMAEIVGCRPKSLWRFASEGRITQPVRMIRGPMWLRSQVACWLERI